VFSLVFVALGAKFAIGSISIMQVRSFEKLSLPEKAIAIANTSNQYHELAFLFFELNYLAYVLGFIAWYLFFYKYWRLSLKLELAARISVFDVQSTKIWQCLLFIFPNLVGAAAVGWLVFDEMNSVIFLKKESCTYNRGLGTFLTAFPSYFLLIV
jgi:hypothetical protein